MSDDEHPCACDQCDGDGSEDVRKDCTCCEGSGKHYIEAQCGAYVEKRCRLCDTDGTYIVEGNCPRCDGTGLDHDTYDSGRQQTLTNDVVDVITCSTCDYKRIDDTVISGDE
jgi:RecJ-like exonuclease